MYRHISVVSFAVLIFLNVTRPPVCAAPTIACDEPVKDFGTVNNNTQSLDCAFTVWNRGTGDLQIMGVNSSCGCTTANAGESTVKPGASTHIKASFTLMGRKGVQKKEIRVTSNDPNTPQLVLQLSCDIRLPIETDATGFFFSRIPADSQTVSRTVRMYAASNVTFRISSIDTSAAPSVILDMATTETGRVYALTATVRMDKVPAGFTQERITVFTDHPAFSKIELPVSLYKSEEVMVIPNELPLLDTVLRQPEVRRDLYLRIQGTNMWEFFDIEPVGNFHVVVEERAAGRCRIVLSNLSVVDDAGTMRLAVTVRSPTTGAERRLEVKLRRYVPKRPAGAGASHTTTHSENGTFRQIRKKDPPQPSPQ